MVKDDRVCSAAKRDSNKLPRLRSAAWGAEMRGREYADTF